MAGRIQLDSQQCSRRAEYLFCQDPTATGDEVGAHSRDVWRSDDRGFGLLAISSDTYVGSWINGNWNR